jgi:hypothetical protein
MRRPDEATIARRGAGAAHHHEDRRRRLHAEEQAMGWYYSLEDRLHFPFVARCIAERAISPLRVGDEVEVVGMAPEEECQHEMFVLIRWERRTLAVPLAQLEGIAVDEQTRQAIQDWYYWVAQGYEL